MEPIEIHYAGRLAAFSWGEDVLFAPHIGVLDGEHPDRLFVGLIVRERFGTDALTRAVQMGALRR